MRVITFQVSDDISILGSYLLSGGHECVLVKWQMSTLHKDFLPRLGSAISHIVSSQDGTLTATCQQDNGKCCSIYKVRDGMGWP